MYKESFNMYIKELDMYKEINMYIKRIGTYTVREAHDRLRNSRKKRFGFLSSNRVDHGKRCVSLLKCFEKVLKMFLKDEIYS